MAFAKGRPTQLKIAGIDLLPIWQEAADQALIDFYGPYYSVSYTENGEEVIDVDNADAKQRFDVDMEILECNKRCLDAVINYFRSGMVYDEMFPADRREQIVKCLREDIRLDSPSELAVLYRFMQKENLLVVNDNKQKFKEAMLHYGTYAVKLKRNGKPQLAKDIDMENTLEKETFDPAYMVLRDVRFKNVVEKLKQAFETVLV